jgi:hypothetical protein
VRVARNRKVRIPPAEISTEKVERRCEVSTPRTDALCARLQPLADSLIEDNFGEVSVKCIAESLVLCAVLERELAELREAVAQTLRENAHLADGENCTLIRLKRALAK